MACTFVRIPDHILWFVIHGLGKFYDLVATLPDIRLYIIRIGHRLADIEMMRPTREISALEVITQRPMHRGLLGGAPIWIWRDQG